MAIHLYLAPAGAGKTEYVLQRACGAALSQSRSWGARVCVSSRLQARAWRQRLAQAGGAIGVRVSTFDDLYAECLAAAGEAYTMLDAPVQYRLLRALVDTLPLAHFAPLRGCPGFIQVLQELIAELKAARIRPEDFRRAVDSLNAPPRLGELAGLYAAYQERLRANEWVDRAGLAWLAVAALSRANVRLGGVRSLFVVDGFDNFTQVQIDLLRALAPRSGELLVTLTGDLAPRTPAHRRFNRTRARLEAALGVRAERLPTCSPDPAMACAAHFAPALAYLEAHLFGPDSGPVPLSGPTLPRVGAALGGCPPHRAATQGCPYTGEGRPGQGDKPAVELIEATDRAAEVRAALRWLKARIVLDDIRPDEAALLARSVFPYRPFVLQIAAEFGLPIRLEDGLPLRANPAVAALLDLLGLTLPRKGGPALPWRQVVEAWRSPYFDWGAYPSGSAAEPIGITIEDAGRLDALARQARVVGGLGQWEEALRPAAVRAARIDDAVDESEDCRSPQDHGSLLAKFHRFVERITPPPGERACREFVRWVEALIGADTAAASARFPRDDDQTSLRVVERARSAPSEVAEADVAALIRLKDVLRGLVTAETALDTEAGPGLDFARFYADVIDVVQSTSYELAAESDRRAILVADVTQARGLPLRAVAVLGLGEGEFPAPRREDPFLRDADRRAMRDGLGLPLDLSTESAESEYFYETTTRARERLLLVRSRLADNGATWQASPFWEEVRRWVDVRPTTLIGDAAPQPAQAASWPELMESFAAMGRPDPDLSPGLSPVKGEVSGGGLSPGLPRTNSSIPGSVKGEVSGGGLSPFPSQGRGRERGLGPAAHRWADVTAAGEVFRARYAEPSEGAPFDGDLSSLAEALGRAYGPEHVWSASRLESYRSCPFLFFVSRVLGLEPRAEPVEGLDAAQLGNIYHRLFERLYAAVDVGIDPQADREALAAALPGVAAAVLDEAPAREGFRATAWWDQTRREIEARAARSVNALALYGPEFVPRYFEMAFGIDDAPPLVLRGDSDEIRLHGYIDRVDVNAHRQLRVIDYKTGGPAPFTQRAVRDGKKLQLPLYALAARDALGLGEPVEAFYWHVQQAEPSSFVLSQFKPSPGVAFEAAEKATWEAVRGIRGGRFVPHPPDGGCPSYCPAAGFCWRCRPGFGG